MTVNKEEGKLVYAITKGKPKPRMVCQSRLRRARARCVELPSDMWFNVLSRLPTKSLLISKRVCKAWRDIASHILAYSGKMPFLPVCGVFFEVNCYLPGHDIGAGDINDYVVYLIYISLTTKELSARIDSPGKHIVNHGYNEQLLGNLSLDLSALYVKPSSIDTAAAFYTSHNGLLLAVHIDRTYQVHNPATKQVLELPKPSDSMKSHAVTNRVYNNAIINLSSPFSSTACFVVIRFLKPKKLVEIYYPKIRKWVLYGFSLEDRLLKAHWALENCVFLHECRTLFVLTELHQGVAFEFGSLDDEPKICSSYGFCLPEVVVSDRHYYLTVTLGVSQGCLYLSYENARSTAHATFIWKYDGVSSANPWILLFEVSKTNRLCKPVAEKHLVNKFFDAGLRLSPVGFHPEAPIVFIHISAMPPSIFAYDLTNDTVEKIAVLDHREFVRLGAAYPYSPCLASLGPFMRCGATFCRCFFCA